jgi:hypothetical protein
MRSRSPVEVANISGHTMFGTQRMDLRKTVNETTPADLSKQIAEPHATSKKRRGHPGSTLPRRPSRTRAYHTLGAAILANSQAAEVAERPSAADSELAAA